MELNTGEWKEFRVGDIIPDIHKACSYIKDELCFCDRSTENTVRYITRTAENNGSEGIVLNTGMFDIEAPNRITVGDTTATCFYQNQSFICGEHMVVLRAKWMNAGTGLFISTILQQEQYKYSYGRAYLSDRIADTIIRLPATPDREPDWI